MAGVTTIVSETFENEFLEYGKFNIWSKKDTPGAGKALQFETCEDTFVNFPV